MPATMNPTAASPNSVQVSRTGPGLRRAVVNVPRYLGAVYALYALMPRLMCWLMRVGGNGRRDYGQVQWRYDARCEVANRCQKGLQ